MNKTDISNHLRSFNTAEHECVICGAKFTAYKQAKYCSNACQQRAKYARMKAKKAETSQNLGNKSNQAPLKAQICSKLDILFKEYSYEQIISILELLNIEFSRSKSGVLCAEFAEQKIYFYHSDTPVQNKQNLIKLFQICLN